MYVFCFSCSSATFALQRGRVVPCKWLAAKDLLEVTFVKKNSNQSQNSLLFTINCSILRHAHLTVCATLSSPCSGIDAQVSFEEGKAVRLKFLRAILCSSL